MKNKIAFLISLFLVSVSSLAQTVYTFPSSSSAIATEPLGGAYSITAYIDGSTNHGITWTKTGGTFFPSTTTCPQTPCTISISSATTGTVTVTATQTGGSASASQQFTFIASPTVKTGNPKLLLTPSLITTLQTRCTSSYVACAAIKTNAIGFYNTTVSTLGFTYTCNGGTGLPTAPVDYGDDFYEIYSYYFAYMSLVDPSDPTYNWGCYARDIFMFVKNGVTSGQLEIQGGNQWSQATVEFSQTPDMLLGGTSLSAADKLNINEYLAYFEQQLLDVNAQGGQGSYDNWNTPSQFNFIQVGGTSLQTQRGMGSNYSEGKTLEILSDAVVKDDNTTDDPPITTGGVVSEGMVTPGTGWAVGDQCTVAGGFKSQVATVASGVPTELFIVTPGSGFTNPGGSPVTLTCTAVSPSVGTGLTLSLLAGNTCGASRYVLCPDYTGGSLHAYLAYFSGAFMLKQYGHWEDPAVTLATLNSAYPTAGFGTAPPCTWTIGGPTSCLGDGIGGEASEGEGYWGHVAYPTYDSTILYNVGLNDPRTPAAGGPYYGGPQMNLVNSSYFDLMLLQTRNFLLNFGANGQSVSPGYTMLTTGDTNHYVFFPADFENAAALYLYDFFTGRTDRNNAEQWIMYNSAYGGPLGTSGGCTHNCGFDGSLANGLGQTLAQDILAANSNSDPTSGTLPTDPGINYPTSLYVNSYNQHQTIRSGYSASDSIVSIYGTNAFIDHEHEYEGGYIVAQNGEYITKGRVEFDNDYNDAMNAAIYQNTATYINTGGTYAGHCLGSQQGPAILYGGQFFHGYQFGPLNVAFHSETPNYAGYNIIDTNAYNGCPSGDPGWIDVQNASRDIIYLRGSKQIITYDRGQTSSTNDKSTYIITTGPITVTGNQACWATKSTTQKGCLTSILPTAVNPTSQPLLLYTSVTGPFSTLQAGNTMQLTCTAHYVDGTTANITSSPLVNWFAHDASPAGAVTVSTTGLVTAVGSSGQSGFVACAPYNIITDNFITIGSSSSGTISNTGEQTQLQDPEPYASVQVDGGTGTNQQFLALFQWGSSSLTPATGTLVQSTSGQGYDGIKVGSNLSIFMRTLASFTGTTFPASSATNIYVDDLIPGGTYTITGAGTPANCTADYSGICNFAATGTGNITLGASTPPIFIQTLGTLHSLGSSSILH